MACCILLAAIFAVIMAMKARIFRNNAVTEKPLAWRPEQKENNETSS